MRSILDTSSDECFICKTTQNLQTHHIFEGSRRMTSDEYGFTVRLCATHHADVHHYAAWNRWLKKLAQRKYEEKHSRKTFMAIIGKNYISEEEQ